MQRELAEVPVLVGVVLVGAVLLGVVLVGAVLVGAVLLGAVFVGGQVYEFTAFYREGLGYTTNLFGTSFFTLTGFHGVHVSLGIVMLMTMYIMATRGKLTAEKSEKLEIIGLYWHFVDVVWIVIFTIVYLFPQ